MKVEMGKKYKIKMGMPVRILCTDRVSVSDSFPVIALMRGADEETVGYYTAEGKSYWNSTSYDLVEVNEWDDFEIDQKVMVSIDNVEWNKRYFAGAVPGGYPTAFKKGMTSWTAGVSDVRAWEHCRLPTDEELK